MVVYTYLSNNVFAKGGKGKEEEKKEKNLCKKPLVLVGIEPTTYAYLHYKIV